MYDNKALRETVIEILINNNIEYSLTEDNKVKFLYHNLTYLIPYNLRRPFHILEVTDEGSERMYDLNLKIPSNNLSSEIFFEKLDDARLLYEQMIADEAAEMEELDNEEHDDALKSISCRYNNFYSFIRGFYDVKFRREYTTYYENLKQNLKFIETIFIPSLITKLDDSSRMLNMLLETDRWYSLLKEIDRTFDFNPSQIIVKDISLTDKLVFVYEFPVIYSTGFAKYGLIIGKRDLSKVEYYTMERTINDNWALCSSKGLVHQYIKTLEDYDSFESFLRLCLNVFEN